MAASMTAEAFAGLLRRAGEAHHAAFAEADGADPDWAIWYAGWLQAHLGTSLGGVVLSRSELTFRLVRAEREHKAAGKKGAWPDAYAASMMKA